MKVLAFLLVTVALTSVFGSPEKEYQVLKKWTKMKAMESCFGKENMKKWMVKMKKASAKCSGREAPELDLPMFQSPYRVIQALLSGAERMEELKMQNLYQTISHTHQHSHQQQPIVVPVAMPQQEDSMEKFMKHLFLAKMMKKMHKHGHGGHGDMDEAPRRDHDDDEDMMPLFKSAQKYMSGNMRFKRDTDMLDLGDKLSEKLLAQKAEIEMEISNHTCMLRECGMIDQDNEIQLDVMLKEMDEYQFEDEWLKEKLTDCKRNCYDLSQSLPRAMLDECPYGLGKLKMFMKCMKMAKLKTCMHFDVKQKLEENFGPLNKLTAATGLRENELFPLVMKLLHGDMMDM